MKLEIGNDRARTFWGSAATIFGLLWLAAPVIDLAGSDPPAWQAACAAVGVLVFAAMFLAVVPMQRPLVGPLVVMLGLAVALTLMHDTFALLFVYAASAVGVRLTGRAHGVVVAAITALAAATLALTSPDGGLFWAVTSAVLAAGALWLLIGGLLRANAALRDARAELAEFAVAEERLRFARDLHDLLGHDLSLIALKAQLAGRLLPGRVEDAGAEIADIETLTRSALAQVREAVDGYRRPTLAGELAGARVALDAAGIELQVSAPSMPLAPEVESVLAWAVREAATNTIRHSGARRAEIRVTPRAASAELEITDDGNGGRARQPEGHGLTGLRERVAVVGGTVEAGPGSPGGFRLRVCVPSQASAVAA